MQFYESFCSIVHNCIVTIVPQNTYSCALVCMIILDKSVLVTIKRNTQILCIGYNLLKWLSFPSINPKYDDILLGIYVPAFEHQNQNKIKDTWIYFLIEVNWKSQMWVDHFKWWVRAQEFGRPGCKY